MTTRIPRVQANATIGDVQKLLREHSRSFDTINYIYVIDEAEALIGILSIRELYHHELTVRIGDVCTREHLVSLPPEAPQERAAYLSLKHNVKAIPVIDAQKKLLGVIPSDELLAILYKETHDKFMRMAGVHRGGHEVTIDHILKISPWRSMAHRLPWLFVGLLGGLVMARIIDAFETTLDRHFILAAFIPLMVYMASAVGTQTQAFFIRDLAIERTLRFGKYALRQTVSTVAIGALFGGIIAIVTSVFLREAVIGLAIGFSAFITITSSLGSGLVVPYVFSRFKMDPANASGPIATIIQDIMSITIYFTIASWFLG